MLLVAVGPRSINDLVTAIAYAKRLKAQLDRLHDNLEIVLRRLLREAVDDGRM